MKKGNKTYWKGIEQLKNDKEFIKNAQNEFPEYLPINGSSNNSRRDFLKMMGFGLSAATLASCEAPIKKAIPYVNKPVDIDASIPNYYASSYVSGSDYCSVLVKTREGRPIKIEANKLSKISGGGTSSQVEASVLSLYDRERLQNPFLNGKKSDWIEIDNYISENLDINSKSDKNNYIISNSTFSPSSQKVIEKFKAKHNFKHVQYDQVSYHGSLEANDKSFGIRKIPFYDFSKAKVIVSFDYDFLGSSINHTLFNNQFAKTRTVNSNKKTMSRLYSFESNLSLTGSNADYRIPIKSSEQVFYIASLYNLLAKKYGKTPIQFKNEIVDDKLSMIADDLINNFGSSIIVSSSNDEYVQIVINAINEILNNYNTTISFDTPYNLRSGNDYEFNKLIKDINNDNVGAVIFLNCNPVYDHAQGSIISNKINDIPLSISTSDRMDETASKVKVIAPDNHYLESWNDYEPIQGFFSFSQPTISKLFNTRQFQESLLKWSEDDSDYFDFMKSNWKKLSKSEGINTNFQIFWDQCLHDGFYELKDIRRFNLNSKISNLLKNVSFWIDQNYSLSNGNELVLYLNSSVGDGIQANNPWLQEMPDPISRVCWDNYLSISSKLANELNLQIGDMTTQKLLLKLDSGKEYLIPAIVQPGQAEGTVGLALGYGRKKSGVVGNNVGQDAYEMIEFLKGYQNLTIKNIQLSNSNEEYRIAQTQTHHTIMGRESVIQETTLKKYVEDPNSGQYQMKIYTSKGYKKPEDISLWKGHKYNNHHWGLAIDLNACTGCGSCTIACQAENNVPVVGKDEVLNRREMAWIRIDRYYSSDADVHDLKGLEKASENPDVTFQPMMCQHCNNAPCETVCPVAATTHSTEGLNQMTYNRCIGTRYCANNCPYKVRRFNWFKYHDNEQFDKNSSMNNDLGKMVLNPDVTVRSRGVMEKCSMCIQRIQEGKLRAKKENRRLKDGDINMVCESSCPSNAMIFGDMNDSKSKISKYLKIKRKEENKLQVNEERAYNVLDELKVSPNIWYMRKIRNKKES